MFAIPKLFVSLHPQTKIIGLWCNGNTTDSGPVIPGSNPGSPTNYQLLMTKPAKNAILAGFLCFDKCHPKKVDANSVVNSVIRMLFFDI